MLYLGGQRGVFSKVVLGFDLKLQIWLLWGWGRCLKVTLQKCAEKFTFMSMVGRAEGLACADPGARTPNGTSGNKYEVLLEGWLYFNNSEYSIWLITIVRWPVTPIHVPFLPTFSPVIKFYSFWVISINISYFHFNNESNVFNIADSVHLVTTPSYIEIVWQF